MENFVVLATCNNPNEAYYLKLKLGLSGIDAFLIGNEELKSESSNNKNIALKVQVRSNDVEKAIQVLIKLNLEKKAIPIDENTESLKRILVPIDFSKNSFTACLFAFALAKSIDAEIKLLHIYSDPFIDSRYINTRISFENYERNVLHEIEEMARRNLVAFTQALQIDLQKHGLSEIKFHYNLLKGKPEDQIIALSKTFKPQIIVLGTQGAGKKTNDIVGSVTTKIIENTSEPILVIPENWSYQGFEKLNVLYATEFQNTDQNAFDILFEILKPFNVHFDCVHIDLSETYPLQEMNMFKLESQLKKNHPDSDIKFHNIQHNNLVKGIQEFVDSAKTDIISFISPKRSQVYKIFYPNNLKKMVYQSKIPLLIFHSEKEQN